MPNKKQPRKPLVDNSAPKAVKRITTAVGLRDMPVSKKAVKQLDAIVAAPAKTSLKPKAVKAKASVGATIAGRLNKFADDLEKGSATMRSVLHKPVMQESRYTELASRMCGLRIYARDTLRGYVLGKDTGLPLHDYYKRPVPEAIRKNLVDPLEATVKSANAAIQALVKQWQIDYPEAELPKEVTCEFETK
jgi:hypothetical protein